MSCNLTGLFEPQAGNLNIRRRSSKMHTHLPGLSVVLSRSKPAGIERDPETQRRYKQTAPRRVQNLETDHAVFLCNIAAEAQPPPGEPRVEVGTPEPAKKVDPVCGMEVDPASAAATVAVNGATYYFCSADCRDRFQAPQA